MFPRTHRKERMFPTEPKYKTPQANGEAEQHKSSDDRGIGLPLDDQRPIDAFLPGWKNGIQMGLKKTTHEWQARDMNECGVFVIVSRIVTGYSPRRILETRGASQFLLCEQAAGAVFQDRMERWIDDHPAPIQKN